MGSPSPDFRVRSNVRHASRFERARPATIVLTVGQVPGRIVGRRHDVGAALPARRGGQRPTGFLARSPRTGQLERRHRSGLSPACGAAKSCVFCRDAVAPPVKRSFPRRFRARGGSGRVSLRVPAGSPCLATPAIWLLFIDLQLALDASCMGLGYPGGCISVRLL